MIHLDLADAEADALRETLNGLLSDLRLEIAETDSPEFSDSLQLKRSRLERIMEQLPRVHLPAIKV